MGKKMLIDGEWNFNAEEMTDEGGEFQRSETAFRDRIEEEADLSRYHLYISRACPWAHGAVLVRKLLGLEEISMDIVDPWRGKRGWQFSPRKDDTCTEDSIYGHDFLYQVYLEADPGYTGRVTVPVLWDRKENNIVNNESIEIMKMLAEIFNTRRDLYPEEKREEIDKKVERLYKHVNNGVYRAGFAESQEAYDKAAEKLFDELDHWNKVLNGQRYLVGDQLTLADLRLFATLVRFDEVYHTHFKCNRKKITEYGNLWPYLRDLYQTTGIAGTVNMDHIKEHYYTTHESVNPKKLTPVGPNPEFEKQHSRDKLS